MWPHLTRIRHNSSMGWPVGASLIVLLALTAWALRRRRRPDEPRARADRRSRSASPDEAADLEARPSPPKSCPVCLSEHPPEHRFCVRDGAALMEGAPSGPFAQGMICPACRRGYPADASFCPEDAEELVPYGLYAASSSTRMLFRHGTAKICPECGVRHAPSHLFCGHDGTELVVVN